MNKKLLYVFLSMLLFAGCAQASDAKSVQMERDHIFMLLAYAVVASDWQVPSTPLPRGHNIGAVLVNAQGEVVFWARNAVRLLNNSTQHGEVRLIEHFLSCDYHNVFASGYTVYTTLEPCAMCTGMMALTQVSKVVYGQDDNEYGGVLSRLQQPPRYPRVFEEVPANFVPQKKALEAAWVKSGYAIIPFLLSEEARQIFISAEQDLRAFQVQFTENKASLESALALLKTNLKEVNLAAVHNMAELEAQDDRRMREICALNTSKQP